VKVENAQRQRLQACFNLFIVYLTLSV
jgi:hypothetical protein